MINGARKWAVIPVLMGILALVLWAQVTPSFDGIAQAARPNQADPGTQVRRESGPPSTGPAPITGPASPYRPLDLPNWGDNVRANTDTQTPNLAQQEPSIAINPLNPLNVVAAAKDERAGTNTKQIWIYTSTDGGQTWLNQMFPLIPPVASFSSDPVVNFSDDGICYVTALPYGSGTVGIQVSKSTDGGITFGPATIVTTNANSDKEWTWIDNFPSSPYYHRVYVAWMDFSPGFRVTYSTDRGQTWVQSSVGQSANQFPMPVVLPNGDVIVTYRASGGNVAYIRSTNGGQSFGTQQNISSLVAPSRPPGSVFRLSPVPATGVNRNNGDMVTMWADGGSGGSIIRYSRSTDNGNTWSASAILAPPAWPRPIRSSPGSKRTSWASGTPSGMTIAIAQTRLPSTFITASQPTMGPTGVAPCASAPPPVTSISAYRVAMPAPQATI